MTRFVTLVAVCLGTTLCSADDWPQWMGPGRDNVWRETGVLEKFPEGGPRILWSTPIEGGYAGPAVVDGRVYVTDYVTEDNVKVANFQRESSSGTERVLCLDANTGGEIWRHEYDAKYTISYPAGPRCTPTIDENRVYTLGAEGNLFCFDKESGDVIWSKDLKTEYGTTSALWGYSNHPLVDGDKLICVVGGKGSHVVAFDKRNGTEIWKALTASEQGYSPPLIIEAAGRRQLILHRPDAVSSVDPDNGELFWSVPYSASNGSIIMTPIQWEDYLFSGGYSNKNILLKLDSDEPDAEVEWQDVPKAGISPVNVQPFRVDNVVYGFDQGGSLLAFELPSGKRLWDTPEPLGKRPQGSGTAFIFQNGDRFWLFNELGELIIAKLSPEGYEEIDRAKVIEPSNVAFGRDVVWSNPAFANRRAYIRNDEKIICVDLTRD